MAAVEPELNERKEESYFGQTKRHKSPVDKIRKQTELVMKEKIESHPPLRTCFSEANYLIDSNLLQVRFCSLGQRQPAGALGLGH